MGSAGELHHGTDRYVQFGIAKIADMLVFRAQRYSAATSMGSLISALAPVRSISRGTCISCGEVLCRSGISITGLLNTPPALFSRGAMAPDHSGSGTRHASVKVGASGKASLGKKVPTTVLFTRVRLHEITHEYKSG